MLTFNALSNLPVVVLPSQITAIAGGFFLPKSEWPQAGPDRSRQNSAVQLLWRVQNSGKGWDSAQFQGGDAAAAFGGLQVFFGISRRRGLLSHLSLHAMGLNFREASIGLLCPRESQVVLTGGFVVFNVVTRPPALGSCLQSLLARGVSQFGTWEPTMPFVPVRV